MSSALSVVTNFEQTACKKYVPEFRVGGTVRVHAKIVEGQKERVQVFEGIVIRRKRGNHLGGSFTVRKVSYNIGVERTFFVHSPRIEKIEVLTTGQVRRARLFYLRDLRGKAAKIQGEQVAVDETVIELPPQTPAEVEAAAAASTKRAEKKAAKKAAKLKGGAKKK